MTLNKANKFMQKRSNRLLWYGEATGGRDCDYPVVQIGYHDGFLYVLEWNGDFGDNPRPENYVSAYDVQNIFGEVEFDTTIEDAEKKMPRLNWRRTKPLPQEETR